MLEPSTDTVALLLMLTSMLCWGSWANMMKLTSGWPFQAFYWNYVLGIVLVSFGCGALFGGPSFFSDMLHASLGNAALAFVGGLVFNLANQLLVGAIELAGMAVAFPIGIGIALVLGTGLNYVISPAGNPWLLLGGVLTVLAAIIVDALAHKRREEVHHSSGARGLKLSVIAGLLMGTFYPFVAASFRGSAGLNAYTVQPYFALGIVICATPVNLFLMRRPFSGERITGSAYLQAPLAWHIWSTLGGVIWACGAAANFIASAAHLVGPSASYAIGQGATMVSAGWGVFVWREFSTAPASSRRLIPLMFVLFLAGLAMVAIAPIAVKGVTR